MEQTDKPVKSGRKPASARAVKPVPIMDIGTADEIRFSTGMGELDRVLGGGAVKGSLVLVGGAPGIGKSTLMLQICKKLGEFSKVLYVSGEESAHQLKLRAQRLDVESENLYVLSETCLGNILECVQSEQPDVLIVDSIQTLYNEDLDSPGRRGGTGEGLHHGPDAAGQGPGGHGIRHWPCEQGGVHCRAQGPGAHGGLRAVFRGGSAHDVPHSSGGKKTASAPPTRSACLK